MKKMLKNKKGFTLIELMIVVAIIGILAAIAIPNFMTYQCKAKQSEAKTLLAGVRTAQETYFAEQNTYTDTLANLDFQQKGNGIYDLSIESGDQTGFKALAKGNLRGTADDDQWYITDNGTLDIEGGNNACD